MPDDSTPEPLDVYSKGGELFTFIGGQVFHLKPTASSLVLMKKLAKENGDDWDAPSKRQSVTTPTPPADPKALARRRAASEAIEELDAARNRFASQKTLREQFDVGPASRPGDADFDSGEERYLRQLAKTV